MSQVDGSIIINTELDNSGIRKGLPGIKKSMESIKKEAGDLSKYINDINGKIKQQQKDLAKLKAKYEKLNAEAAKHEQAITPEMFSSTDPRYTAPYDFFDPNDKAFLQREKIESQYLKAASTLSKLEADLESAKRHETRLAKEAEKAAAAQQSMANAAEATSETTKRLARRVSGLFKRVLFYSVIAIALRHIREWMVKVLQTNDEFTSALGRLKGALLTAFQPLWETVLPWLMKFVQILTKVVTWIAAFFSWLTGKSLAQSALNAKALNEQTKALEETGAAAEKAAGSLAAFDEVNVISQTEAGSAGGTSAGGAGAPSFDFDTAELERIAAIMDKIGDYVVAIGLGLAAWKIARSLGALPQTAAAIAMIAAGIYFVVDGFREWFTTGELTNETLGKIVIGIMLIGAGIAILTGSWIPLVIAAIVALLLTILNFFGDTEQFINGWKTAWEGLKDFFVGVFTGDMEMAIGGIGKIFSGLTDVGTSVIDAVKNAFNSFLDWLDEKTGGKLSGIIEWIRKLFNDCIEDIKSFFTNGMQSVQQILSGVVQFLSGVFTGDWERAWEGLQNIAKGALNLLISVVEGAVNLVVSALNALIRGINKILSFGDGIAESIFGKAVRIPEIPKLSLPRLAQGTVVPANREFLAVLGDNKREPEVVSPLSTIRQAVAEALAANGGGGNAELIALLREQNELLAAILDKEVLPGEPSASFGRYVSRSINKYETVRG